MGPRCREGLKKKDENINCVPTANANQFRHHLNHFYAQVKTLYLDIGPNQIRLHSQKLVFKAIIWGDGGPVGVSRGHAPLESEVFYYFKRFLEVLVMQQSSILNLPS